MSGRLQVLASASAWRDLGPSGSATVGDKLIRENVIDELDFEPSVEAAHIGVAVD